MCCKRLAGNTGRKSDAKNCHLSTIAQKIAIWAPSHNFVGLSSELRHVSTIGKKLVKQQYLLQMSLYNMVNFGPLTAEIDWRVWSTPSYFNGYRVLAALVHGSQVVGVSQTLRRWTEGVTYGRHSAGRPSRWALAHILVLFKELTQ